MLLLLAKTFEHVVGANFHDVDFLLEASLGVSLLFAALIGADFSGATTRDGDRLETDVDVIHYHLTGSTRTLVITECLVLAIWIPLIVGLIVAMVLMERIIDGAVRPVEDGHSAEEPGNRHISLRVIVVRLTDGVELLIEIRMNNLISPVVMRLLPEVLMPVGGHEVVRHAA